MKRVVPPQSLAAVVPQKRVIRIDELNVPPIGWIDVDNDDKTGGYLTDVINGVVDMAGADGLRHIEVRRMNEWQYRCVFVGFRKVLTMENMASILYDGTAASSRKSHVIDAYVEQRLDTALLCQWESRPMASDPRYHPALVVCVASRAFLTRMNTVDTSGGSLLVDKEFEGDAQKCLSLRLERSLSVGKRVVLTTAAPGGGGKVSVAVRGKRLLPQIDVEMFPSLSQVSEKGWSSPLPNEDSKAFTPYARSQIDAVFGYLHFLHGRDAMDTPTEMVLEKLSPTPSGGALSCRCISMGYRNPIGLRDMLGMYVCDMNAIEDVGYDFDVTSSSGTIRGGLVVQISVVDDQGREPPLILGNPDQKLLAYSNVGLARVVVLDEEMKEALAPTVLGKRKDFGGGEEQRSPGRDFLQGGAELTAAPATVVVPSQSRISPPPTKRARIDPRSIPPLAPQAPILPVVVANMEGVVGPQDGIPARQVSAARGGILGRIAAALYRKKK